ncbi:hypothetical protein [Nonomuraea wenchangensis]|uniref:hypothetical protein n=2 Tax=Nonomuraea wenchangensis TaxID=568860 RepID=UPI0037BD5CAD
MAIDGYFRIADLDHDAIRARVGVLPETPARTMMAADRGIRRRTGNPMPDPIATGSPLSAVASAVDHDLPEPTSYRGRFLIPLNVPGDAWLRFHGISYWLDPVPAGDVGTGSLSLISEDGLELSCEVYDGTGRQINLFDQVPDRRNPGAKSLLMTLRETLPGDPPLDVPHFGRTLVEGTSLTLRVNYAGSGNVKDVVLRIEFGEQVALAMDRRRLCVRAALQPVTSTALRAADEARPQPRTPLIYLHGYEDPDTGAETIGGRLPPIALTRERITQAWQNARTSGFFDPAVFPNVAAGQDQAARAGVLQAVGDLDEAGVAERLLAGDRLVVYREATGTFTYRFVPAPVHCAPGLVLVEYYRLTSFPARYGAGRTVKTFSLLPGERTAIRISTYKRSSESLQKTSSILDATSNETEAEFARTINSEQSNQANASQSFEYRAEIEAQGQANWGWGSASARASAGVSGSTGSAREEFTKNLTNAVSQNTARASARREVQIDTSIDVKLEQGEESAVERTLENINVSRTLNFVFRQMNQEYVTLLHLVDVRVAFFNGHAESRDEVPLSELDRLLRDCVDPDHLDAVRTEVLAQLATIADHTGRIRDDLVEIVPADGDRLAHARVRPGITSSYTGPDGRTHTVPGVIVTAGEQVLRTDGVTVDAFLGEGDALDAYSTGLQQQAVRAKEAANQGAEIDNEARQAEAEQRRLAVRIVADNDRERADLYQRLFVRQQIVNQIDHAAVTALPDGDVAGRPDVLG